MAQEQQNEARKGYPISKIRNDCKLIDVELTLRCVEFTWNCLAKDTMIDVCCNEIEYPEGIPIQDLVGKTGLLFSFDENEKKPVVKAFKNVRLVAEDATLLEIAMEEIRGGQGPNRKKITSFIRVTPEHRFLVKKGFRDLAWVEAKDLVSGDRLISDQRNKENPDTVDLIREHYRQRLICEHILGRKLLPFPLEIVHHKDDSHRNNSPINLEVKSQSEHFKAHRNDFTYRPVKNRSLPVLNHSVLSVTSAGTSEVYDMEVEDTHCLFANGVVVHNCDLKTHAPDFGIVEIKYVPNEYIAETKAMKQYLTMYRYRDCFAEELTQRILFDFLYYIEPIKIEVVLKQNRRGGIINVVTMRWDSLNEDDVMMWNKLRYTPKNNFRGGFALLKETEKI